MIAAIVLTAGKSERMGQPKALLRYRGRTFLEHILDAIQRSVIEYTVVVTGHHRDAIEKSTSLPRVIFNSDYEKGMSTSAQAGIRGLPAEVSAAALFLVDHPIINPATIDILAKHVSPGRIILPTHSGKRGHPVLFAAELFPEILSLPSNAGLNTIVRRDAARIVEVSVDFRGILTDVDTPDDYAKLLAENA